MPIIPGITVNITDNITTMPTPIKPSSLMATILVGIIPTLMCVGVSNLPGRLSLNCQNNSLNSIYLGNTNTVSPTTGILLASGATMEFNFDPSIDTNIYGISIAVPSNISIVEA
jgi:hypothetical protein